MQGSWRLTRIAGIDVSIHWTFVLLLVFVVLSSLFASGLVAAVSEAAFICSLFGCVVLHELGHAMAARAFGSDYTTGGLANVGVGLDEECGLIIGVRIALAGIIPDMIHLQSNRLLP